MKNKKRSKSKLNIKNKKIIIIISLGFLLVVSGTTTATILLRNIFLRNKDKKVETKVLVKESFKFSGTSGSSSKVAFKTGKNLPEQVEAKYSKAKTKPENDSDYKASVPTDLKNGDKVFVKFFVKAASASNYAFPSEFVNPLELTVSGLDKKAVDTANLKKNSFVFSRKNGSGTVAVKSGKSLPSQIGIRYLVSKTIPITSDLFTSGFSFSTFSTSVPTNLKNGNWILVQFFVKADSANNYKFPNGHSVKTIFLTVSGLT